jgi:predicted phosphoribosyltransferase
MIFASREDAGERLGRYLQAEGVAADLVLGLPRGGVVVAAAAAKILGLPLDTLIVRKIGHPVQREFAVGALAEGDVVLFDEAASGLNPLLRAQLDQIVAEEQQRLAAYRARFHPRGIPVLAGRRVLLVDDGLATGATTEAAVLSARKQCALSVVVAVPVAASRAVERIERVADQVKALLVDPEFEAVGRYYDVFSQTTDEEVSRLLEGNPGDA